MLVVTCPFYFPFFTQREADVRHLNFRNLTTCNLNEYVNANACGQSDQRLWECTVTIGANCIYLYTCFLGTFNKLISCTQILHLYSSIVCCNPKCNSQG